MGRTSTEKLKRYIKDGRPSKFKSFIKKRRKNLMDIKLKKQRSLLHYCCKYGNEVLYRYLTDTGLDPFLADTDGNLPLHLALERAVKMAETETIYNGIILPQLEQFPQLLEVKNNDGTSCRTLLDRLVATRQRNKVDQDDQHGEDSDVDWTQKLSEEMQYEFSDYWGHTEHGFNDDYTQETYDEWAERMNSEFHRKRKQSQAKSYDSSKTKYAKQETKTSEENDKLKKAREEMQQKYEKYQKEARENNLKRKRLQYEEKCKKLFSKEQTGDITFDDIPWPFKDDVKEISVLLFCGDSTSSNREFYRKYLREQQIRWHPDKFVQKLGHVIRDGDRDRILETVKIVSQELNGLNKDI